MTKPTLTPPVVIAPDAPETNPVRSRAFVDVATRILRVQQELERRGWKRVARLEGERER